MASVERKDPKAALVSEDLKAALMSVYYHSLGRQLELRGAPSVLLPPVVRPIPIERALDIVREEALDRRQEVLWTMLRSTPPPPPSRSTQTLRLRYPAPLRSFAQTLRFSLDDYDEKRARYRAESGLFAAALTAYARGQRKAFDAFNDTNWELEKDEGLGRAVQRHEALGGDTLEDYLRTFAEGDQETTAKKLARLQDEAGLTLQALVNDLADCMAFLDGLPEELKLARAGTAPYKAYRVFPTSAVVVQDSQNLTTTVTVTTLVRAESRDLITKALDPQNWPEFSDAFREVQYVKDAPTRFTVAASPELGAWHTAGDGLLLREVVAIPSGLSPTVVARFENVLNITFRESPDDKHAGGATLTYSLYRSVNSRYLWDVRPGGILLDQGYIKVRPLGASDNKTWRVTIRKVVRFADRTPASWGDTPLQFGQSLNYLAPAALNWWLQSQMYLAAGYAGDQAQQAERNESDG
jgi:hypothetical protein